MCAKVAHVKVPLQTKLPMSMYPSFAKVAQCMVHLQMKLPIFMMISRANVSRQIVPQLPM